MIGRISHGRSSAANARLRWFTAIAIMLAAVASPVSARCYFNESPAHTRSETIRFSDADYVRDSVIGMSITQYSNRDEAWGRLTCDQSNYSVTSTATVVGGELVPGYTDVYRTGVDGIGIKFYGPAYGYSNTRDVPFTYSAPSPGPGQSTAFKSAAKLIVTGQVGGGKITSLPSLRIVYKQGPYEAQIYTVTVNAPITIVSQGCRLANRSIGVKLPRVLAQDLATPGATAGDTNFSINLTDCPASVKVYATLTDASKPSNASDILSLGPDSTAQGVGFRVTHTDRTVKFGPDSAAPGTLNQFLITDRPGASVDIPMTVKYVRTEGQLRGGTTNGYVTLNMSYQ